MRAGFEAKTGGTWLDANLQPRVLKNLHSEPLLHAALFLCFSDMQVRAQRRPTCVPHAHAHARDARSPPRGHTGCEGRAWAWAWGIIARHGVQ